MKKVQKMTNQQNEMMSSLEKSAVDFKIDKS